MMLIIESIQSPAALVVSKAKLEFLVWKEPLLRWCVLEMFYLSPEAAWEPSQGRGRTYQSELCSRNQVGTTQMSPSESGAAILGFTPFKSRLHSLEDKSPRWKVINDKFARRQYDSECCCAILANLRFWLG